jgi:hypothetical protein
VWCLGYLSPHMEKTREEKVYDVGEDENVSDAKRRKLDEGGMGRSDGQEKRSDGGGGDPGEATASRCKALRARDKILAVERDYTRYFAVDQQGDEGNDHFVFQHFNTLCVVGLAPSHAALSNGRRIVQVDFEVGGNKDKCSKKVTGKKKQGAT